MAVYLRFCLSAEDRAHFICSCVLILKAWLKMKALVLTRVKPLNPEENLVH